MQTSRVFRFDSSDRDSVNLLTGRLQLADGQHRSTETLLRVVKFDDAFYGEVDITREMMQRMVRNFDASVFGQDIVVDVSHRVGDGAAGFIRRLFVEGSKLRAEIEWTAFGVESVHDRGFRYFSVEFTDNWRDPETEKKHGPVLMGAAITTRPRVKKLDPIDPDQVHLSFDNDDRGYVVSPQFRTLLTEEITTMWEKLKKKLAKKLGELTLSEAVVNAIVAQFMLAVDGITEEARAENILDAFVNVGETTAKQLADLGTDPSTVTLDFSGLQIGGAQLSEDQLRRQFETWQTEQDEARRQLAETRTGLVTIFTDAIEAAEGLSALPNDARERLLSAQELITPEMTEDQVRRLAEHQIQLGGNMAVAYELGARGFPGPGGSPRVSVDDTNNIRALQEGIDRRLGLSDMPDSRRFANTGGQLLEENRAFADAVLTNFDRERGAGLQAEHRQFAGGDGIVSDVSVPVIWERTVIREALYNLIGLQFVDAGVLDFATSYMIPYSYRDTSAAGRDDTRRYEGQSIARAGVIQTADTAYNVPQKLAFEVSDELRYLTSASQLNWEIVSENQRNSTRVVGEDLDRMIFNEIVQAADEYSPTAVASENLELQADDAKNIFVLSNFPVVRPRAVYDLQGNQVGSTVNPIVVTYNSVVRDEWDGTGTQAAGTYYVLDYNLGEIQLVDEAGAIQVPANGTAYTIGYSYANNRYTFDTDIPANTDIDQHWDTFLYRYGLRKSEIEDKRYHMANYGLMSGVAMTMIEQAKQFGANSMRAGTDLAQNGNLGRVKDVPNFKTNAPGLWMGDQRVLVGERGISRLRMTKPWTLGELENQKDGNGRFTGKKEAYGDQFVVLHTPTQLKRAMTSIVLYSATARVARVAA